MSAISSGNLSVDLSIGHLIVPVSVAFPSPESMATTTPQYLVPPERVRYTDIEPHDGAPSSTYLRAVDMLSGSLMRHNAVLIELRSEDAAIIRCGLEASRLYFRTRAQNPGKGSRAQYCYRAGRPSEDWDSTPPCMDAVFRCMGKVARAALSAVARHLRLRSDVFNHLLDDNPLPTNKTSASMLVVTNSALSGQTSRNAAGVGKPHVNVEVEKGLLTLISSDYPGLQVCDPNNHWYLADGGSAPGDLLILAGKCLSHATAGLRPAASYRYSFDQFSDGGGGGSGRTSLEFRLMPQGDAILDCSPISAAGHVIPQSYVPISVSRFLDDLSSEEDVICNLSENTEGIPKHLNGEISLRSILSDPLSGAFLEDAMVVTCGHSFGGHMLRKVLDTSRCTICDAEIESNTLIPNHALRAAALAVRHEDDKRLFHNAAIRKRRKEMSDGMDFPRRLNQEDVVNGSDDWQQRKVQYPFVVNEKVLIKGNRRTPDKFVGKEAIITSQCLNGWYCLKITESGENVRLQYRSLKKLTPVQDTDPIQSS